MKKLFMFFATFLVGLIGLDLTPIANAADGGLVINRTPPLPPQPRPPRNPPPHRPPPHRPPPYRPRPPDPEPWPQPPRIESETRYLNRYYMDDRIDIDQLFNLQSWYWGYEVERIDVRVGNADGRYQELSLMVNGYLEDRVRPGYYNTLHVRGFKEVGRDIRRLELFTSGTVLIESITVYLRRY